MALPESVFAGLSRLATLIRDVQTISSGLTLLATAAALHKVLRRPASGWWAVVAASITLAMVVLAAVLVEGIISTTSSFGPPVLFSVRRTAPNASKARPFAYPVRLNEKSRSEDGLIVPAYARAGDTAYVKVEDYAGSVQQLALSRITRLEFKKHVASPAGELWAFECLTRGLSDRGRPELRFIADTAFTIYGANGDKITNRSEILDMSGYGAVRLNGIAIEPGPASSIRTLWLLGYDGRLYRHQVDKVDPIMRRLGRENAEPVTLELTEACDLVGQLNSNPKFEAERRFLEENVLRSLDTLDTRLWGWQSLAFVDPGVLYKPDSASGAVSGDGVTRLSFLASHAIAGCLIGFTIASGDSNVWQLERIHAVRLPPASNEKTWDEGAVLTRAVVDAKRESVNVLLTTEACSGQVRAHYWRGMRCGGRGDGDEIGSELHGLVGLPIAPDRAAYLEGIVVSPETHRVYASDRTGRIWASERGKPLGLEDGHGAMLDVVLDLGHTVKHGQDIDSDPDGGLWIAEESYFRYVAPPRLGGLYGVAAAIRRIGVELSLLAFFGLMLGVPRLLKSTNRTLPPASSRTTKDV